MVISRGVLELLDPAEVEAVVAHELGHTRNWDMVLMTIAGLVPLLAYTVFRQLSPKDSSDSDDNKGAGAMVAIGAFLIYLVSEYLVLWFSRTREFSADRYAARVTGNPNALATALVKIGYGLAAAGATDPQAAEQSSKRRTRPLAGTGALGAFNMFDQRDAVALVLTGGGDRTLDIGRVKGGMQWEDVVLQDPTGIMLLDYRQPFGLWDFFFGAFRAEALQGQEVRVTGWYRRNPSPSLIIDRIEGANLAGPIVCYGPRTRTWVGRFLVVAGLVTSAVMAVGMLAG